MISIVIFPLLLAAASVVSGCAFTTANVKLQYQEMTTSYSLPYGTQLQIPVFVQLFTDDRPQKALGTKKNTYGMETAEVISDDDLANIMTNAFRKELAKLRYRIADFDSNAATIEGRITRFWIASKSLFFSLTVEGQAEALLQLKESPTGPIIWSNFYRVQNASNGLLVVLDSDYQERVDATLKDIVEKIITDRDFHNALRKLQATKGQLQPSASGYEG